jgi:hypothetical protein
MTSACWPQQMMQDLLQVAYIDCHICASGSSMVLADWGNMAGTQATISRMLLPAVQKFSYFHLGSGRPGIAVFMMDKMLESMIDVTVKSISSSS